MFWRRFLPKSWTDPDSDTDSDAGAESQRRPKDVSVNRRGFFRQLAISAIEEAEKAGHEFLDRTNLNEHFAPEPQPRRHYPPPYYETMDMIYGPPWPPPLGPDIPMHVQHELRDQAHRQRDPWYGGED